MLLLAYIWKYIGNILKLFTRNIFTFFRDKTIKKIFARLLISKYSLVTAGLLCFYYVVHNLF